MKLAILMAAMLPFAALADATNIVTVEAETNVTPMNIVWVVYTNGIAETNLLVRYPTDEDIRRLAKDGELCRVLGHCWRDGRPGEGEGSPMGGWYAGDHPGVWYRTCRTCGKCESQGVSEWK